MTDRAVSMTFQLLREVFELARAQREALEQDDLARYDALLDERDALMSRIEQLRAELPERDELPPNVIPFPGAVQPDTEDLLALDTVIRGILEYDRGNEELLRQSREELLSALPGLDAARRGLRGYRASTAPDARFVDRAS